VATTFFFCAALSATAFGGRPGPPGRHFPRALRPRRRPFFAGFPVERPPKRDWIAERTSCCTRSRITVTRFFCLGIVPPLRRRYRNWRSRVKRSGPARRPREDAGTASRAKHGTPGASGSRKAQRAAEARSPRISSRAPTVPQLCPHAAHLSPAHTATTGRRSRPDGVEMVRD
jgi:hypothetical protein